MPCMVVTLDVSRLSGWLNADATCRLTTELVRAIPGAIPGARGVRAWGWWRCMQRAQKTKLDTGHARERTTNM